MNIRNAINFGLARLGQLSSNLWSLPEVREWVMKHDVDTTGKLIAICNNAAALASELKRVRPGRVEDNNFNQKLFYTLLGIVENEFPQPYETPPFQHRSEVNASSSIPLKKLKKYVLVEDVRSALALHDVTRNSYDRIDPSKVIELTSLVESNRENKILLYENQLALVVQLVFSNTPVAIYNWQSKEEIDESKDDEATEFEREEGDEEAQAVISQNRHLPRKDVELSIRIFGEQRTAALLKLYSSSSWDIFTINDIPAIANTILQIPAKYACIFADVVAQKIRWNHFYDYNLEKELDFLYKIVLTTDKDYLQHFLYALLWAFNHDIHSISNTASIIANEDFIEYFPKIELSSTFSHHHIQIIFNLFIEHMQATERLYNIQNQYVFQLLNDENVIPTNLGSDVSTLICEYNGTLETQGFFARKCLRQMPKDKHLDLQDFLDEFKLK
ncbi:MAG: hypothetical protein V4501_07490 [Pseudomonadota bacterium]